MNGENTLSRRQFGAMLTAAPLAAQALATKRLEPPGRTAARDDVLIKARPFPLNQVRLLSGTCYTLQDRNRIYLHMLDDRGLYVNLFVPARVHWPEKGLYVRQETRFPDDDRIDLEFQCDSPVALSLRVRVPYWATQGIEVRLNGESRKAAAEPASYWTIDRTWKTGDRLEVRLPMSVHAHPMPDDPTVQAFMYGPLVLAGAMGNEGLTYEMMYADPVNARRGEGMRGDPIAVPDVVAPSDDPGDWIRPAGGPSVDASGAEVVAGSPLDLTKTAGGLDFRITGQPRPLSLVPLYRLFGQRYAVYWRVKRA